MGFSKFAPPFSQLFRCQTPTPNIETSASVAQEASLPPAYLDAIGTAEMAAVDDRGAALALSRGEPLPPRTRMQVRVEDPTFKIPELPVFESPPKSRKVIFKFTSLFTGRTSKRSELICCLICTAEVASSSSLQVPCGHHYCRDCIQNLIQNYTRDESFHPLRCCQKEIPATAVTTFIPSDLKNLFNAKHAEFSVPAKDRIYCCVSTCSAFLGSSVGKQQADGMKCTARGCQTTTCPRCKEASHPSERDCALNQSTIKLRALAQSKSWQTCPGCQALVERICGCSHMWCRCGAEFCYRCAGRWKKCAC